MIGGRIIPGIIGGNPGRNPGNPGGGGRPKPPGGGGRVPGGPRGSSRRDWGAGFNIASRRAPIEWGIRDCSGFFGLVFLGWYRQLVFFFFRQTFQNGLKLALDLDAPTQSHGHRAPRLRYERNGERRADPAPSTLVSQARRQGQRSLFFQRRSLKKSLRRHHDCSWSPSARSPQLVGHRVAALAAASLALQRPQVHALPGVVLLLILLHLSE